MKSRGSVYCGGANNILRVPLASALDEEWVRGDLPKLITQWLRGHSLLTGWNDQRALHSGDETAWLNQFPTPKPPEISAPASVLTEEKSPYSKMEGALKFLDLADGRRVVHPDLGVIQVMGVDPVDGGTLRWKAGTGPIKTSKSQSEIVVAAANSQAAIALLDRRADALAPDAHVALLFVAHYLYTFPRNTTAEKKAWVPISEAFSRNTATKLDKFLPLLRADLLKGIGPELVAHLFAKRKVVAELAKTLKAEQDMDLVEKAMDFRLDGEQSEWRWPTLGITSLDARASSYPVLKQLEGHAETLPVFVQRLRKKGIDALSE